MKPLCNYGMRIQTGRDMRTGKRGFAYAHNYSIYM